MTDLYRELESQEAIEKSDSDLTNENINDVRKYIETKDNSEGIHVAVSNTAEADTASEAKLQEPNQDKELESKEKVEESSVDLTTEYNKDDNEAQDIATSTTTEVSAENAEEVEKVIDSLFDLEQVAAGATTQDIPVAAYSNNTTEVSAENAEEVEKVIDSLFDLEQIAASATTQDIPVAINSNNVDADSIPSLDSIVYTDESEYDTNVSTPNAEL